MENCGIARWSRSWSLHSGRSTGGPAQLLASLLASLRIVCLLTLVLHYPVAVSAKTKRFNYHWWDISRLQDGQQQDGYRLPTFSGAQREMVENGTINMFILHKARKEFLSICQASMRHRPWNCSETTMKPRSRNQRLEPPPYFGRFIDKPFREAAFVHALSTAVLLQVMVKHRVMCKLPQHNHGQPVVCSVDSINCCSDLVKKFLLAGSDMSPRKRSLLKITEHNRKAGLSVFKGGAVTEDRYCFGTSGACLYRRSFRHVAKSAIRKVLRTSYDRAAPVKFLKGFFGNSHLVYLSWTPLGTVFDVPDDRKPTHEELIYETASQGFCTKKNNEHGLATQTGRRCDVEGNLEGINCDRLCCGKGIYRRIVTEYKVSQCRFVYCCRTHCKRVTEVSMTETYCR